MPEAARVTDPISHTPVLAGILVGILAGAVLAVAVVAVVGTGGLAAPFVAAGIAAAAAGGGLAGGYIAGAMAPMITGAIIPLCSPNVFIGGLNAARALADAALCSGMLPLFPHSPPPMLIAEGSCSVLINRFMAARKTDHLTCGSVIANGCPTVIIGGGTGGVPGLTIEPEVPDWVVPTLFGVLVVGSLIATGGTLAGFVVLGAGVLGSLGGAAIGGYVGEQIGDLTGNKELGKRIGEVAGGLLGGLAAGLGAGKALGGREIPGGRSVPGKIPPDPATTARTGEPSTVLTNRPSEFPYRNPPEMHRVAPGETPPNLDPNKRYLWAVDPDGNVLIAPEEQPGFGRVVKHGDLTPGPGGTSRGPARSGGELNFNEQTGRWEMNNESSYTFARTDGKTGTADNLNASRDLMNQGGMDVSNIDVVDIIRR
jgi:uncharacterized Zn-binding protein involved in type VI secretion